MLFGCFLLLSAYAHGFHVLAHGPQQAPVLAAPTLAINNVPFATRAYWMRQASRALPSACPFAAFGTVVVNHTATTTDGRGQLVCTGANSGRTTGNPTMHGKF